MFPSKDFLANIKDKCDTHCSKIGKQSIVFKELEKVKNELKHSEEVIEVLQKQEAEKDREIQRLNCLFAGGRPINALAKDCCYKDVSKITEDLGKLQRDKVELQMKLSDCMSGHEKLMSKLNGVKKKNAELEAYISEIGDAALFVEKEANLKIKDQKQKINELKECLSKSSQDLTYNEMKNLKKVIKVKTQNEEKLLFEIEYLKNKLKEHERGNFIKNP